MWCLSFYKHHTRKEMNIKNLYRKFYGFVENISGEKPSIFKLARLGGGVVWNYINFRFTITDYFELTLYKKHYFEKKKYLSSKDNLYFSEFVDDKKRLAELCSKTEMYQLLSRYIKREQLYSDKCSYEEFCLFTDKHPRLLYKPDTLDCGRGIEVWNVSDSNREELFRHFTNEPAVLDEMIEQHPRLQELCPGSVNTIRFFTLKVKEECIIIGAALRMGNGVKVVDNYSAGGLVGALDVKTGKVIAEAENATGKRFTYHPYSNVKIVGFQVPNWQDVLEFVKQCALNYELNYVAWDIAVREKDCVLIEANPSGMTNVIQIAGAGGRKEQYSHLKKYFKSKMSKA